MAINIVHISLLDTMYAPIVNDEKLENVSYLFREQIHQW